MKTSKSITTLITIATLLLCGMARTASAQNVEARLSSREAYVGMPVVLQLAIQNASDYESPTAPDIDGCDVRSAGAPSQSSQITIINGRRSENRSVTMQYQITPRRAGTFTIPSMNVNVNGRNQKTQPLRFVATKSETGDLLFVEIEGVKDKVFVGQPLDLTLKIWVKPFADRQNQIKLSEANMWQMISEQTSWGSFSDRLKELAENNQRPGGQEVIRDNGQGSESAYFLYEIEATVYPKRPGKIDADDVQIVVDYPTGLGKSSDPFGSMFEDSPFGGGGGMSSRMQQMMGDDFFGSSFGGSPFGNRLSVTSSRPIVGQASVDSTEVIDVPTEGRPAGYRGAVGRYKIVTQATPTAVSAGDPITLNIGIAGTGPMELVQAPPLTELSSLTADFKVADQSLAGFVQEETKVFSTTIRPRREGITTIPPIPFSFFDPDTEKFETVMSEPISITVDKSESLALDAIVGNARRDRNTESRSASNASQSLEPNFTNKDSASVLVSQPLSSSSKWWLAFVIVPPFVWGATVLVRNRETIVNRIPSFSSASVQCLGTINRAKTQRQIENAVVRYIGKWLRLPAAVSEPELGLEATVKAVGALRTSGMYNIANEVESFLQANSHTAFSGGDETSLHDLQNTSRELVNKMESSFLSMKKSQVRRSNQRNQLTATGNSKTNVRRAGNVAQKASMLLIAGMLAFATTGNAFAQEPAPKISRNELVSGSVETKSAAEPGANAQRLVELTDAQRATIFAEANEAYAKAMPIAKTDSAEANDQFMNAATKYQLLVDSGVLNKQLFTNLGNAYLQSNQLGHAIVNYERAKLIDPTNRQLQANLDFANSWVKGQNVSEFAPTTNSSDTSTDATALSSAITHLRSANQSLVNLIGASSIVWTLAISSLLFWGLLTVGAIGYRLPLNRLAIVPLLILILSATSYGLTKTAPLSNFNGIIVANNVTLHSGDGDQFDEVTTFETAQGHRVQILDRRGVWAHVRTTSGHTGWMNLTDLEPMI